MPCPFCLFEAQPYGEIIFRSETSYILTKDDPILMHSLMIVPLRHVETPFELDEGEWLELPTLLKKAKSYLEAHNPQGYSIGWNVGKVGGQNVAHAHLHVIARFADEPLAGKGIRHHLKQPENKRLSQQGASAP